MANLKTTLRGYATYRGREGQISFLMHRITGLGVLLFLALHIVDTAFVYFAPDLYMEVITLYRSTLFGIGEIGLVFCVFFHGINGLRIAILDLFAPKAWTIALSRNAFRWTLGLTFLLWVPATVLMVRNILIHNFGIVLG